MRWWLLLEEYGLDIRHIKGVDNVVADLISRLLMANNDELSTDKGSKSHERAVQHRE